jgi:hypothetical protein
MTAQSGLWAFEPRPRLATVSLRPLGDHRHLVCSLRCSRDRAPALVSRPSLLAFAFPFAFHTHLSTLAELAISSLIQFCEFPQSRLLHNSLLGGH